jgi:hypothetical protein
MKRASSKNLAFRLVTSKWFEITVALTEPEMAELKVFLTCLFQERSRRRFAEKMLPPRGRIPTSPECKRLDALSRVKQALNLPKEVPAERAYRRIEKVHFASGGFIPVKRRNP